MCMRARRRPRTEDGVRMNGLEGLRRALRRRVSSWERWMKFEEGCTRCVSENLVYLTWAG